MRKLSISTMHVNYGSAWPEAERLGCSYIALKGGRHTSWSGSNSEPRKGGLSKNPKQRPKKGPRKKPRRRKPRRTERLKLRPKKRPRPNWRHLNSGCTRRLFQFKQEVFQLIADNKLHGLHMLDRQDRPRKREGIKPSGTSVAQKHRNRQRFDCRALNHLWVYFMKP